MNPGSNRPTMLVVDDEPAALERIERELSAPLRGRLHDHLHELVRAGTAATRAPTRRRPAGRPRARRPVDARDHRQRAAGAGSRAAPAREAGAPRRMGRLGRSRHRPGDVEGDGPRLDRLLPAQALHQPRRVLPPHDQRFPLRVVAGDANDADTRSSSSADRSRRTPIRSRAGWRETAFPTRC